MINMYDPRSYTRAFELKQFSVDDEITFGVKEGRKYRAVHGLVTAIHKNRIDETDHWVRVRSFDTGLEVDFRVTDMLFGLIEDGDGIPTIKFKPAPGFTKEQLTLPKYQTIGAAGFDFHAAEDKELPVTGVWTVSTGFIVEIPAGYQMEIRPRSGFTKNDILIANSPGTIDSDYRGEVKVMLRNLTGTKLKLKAGQRIAQGVITFAPQFKLEWTEEVSETERGEGGFGSTGE